MTKPTILAQLTERVADGTYLVTWFDISADAHGIARVNLTISRASPPTISDPVTPGASVTTAGPEQ